MSLITGVGLTPFGRLEGRSTLDLMSMASEIALADAGLHRGAIDGVLCGYSTTMPHLMHGIVYATTIVCRAATPEAKAHVPFAIMLIDAAEGFRMMAHGDKNLAIGDAVVARFERFTDRLMPYFDKA